MTSTKRLIELLRDLGYEPYGHCVGVRRQFVAINESRPDSLPAELTDYTRRGFIHYWPDHPWPQPEQP